MPINTSGIDYLKVFTLYQAPVECWRQETVETFRDYGLFRLSQNGSFQEEPKFLRPRALQVFAELFEEMPSFIHVYKMSLNVMKLKTRTQYIRYMKWDTQLVKQNVTAFQFHSKCICYEKDSLQGA